MYDLSAPSEDDALYQVIKDNSIHKIGFFGPESEYLYSMTHIETFSLWKFRDAEKICTYGDVRQPIPGMAVDYLIECMYDPQGRLYLCAGSYTGDVGLIHVGLGELEPLMVLPNGHKDNTVRGVHWAKGSNAFVSGCEIGDVVKWVCAS